MFLNIGHAVINVDEIARVDDTVPDTDGNRCVRITMKDGGCRKASLTMENVQAQLASCIIPAPEDCWMIVASEAHLEGDVIELDFTSLQVVAFRLDQRYGITTPIGVMGPVKDDDVYCILQRDDTVLDVNGEYRSARDWKDERARQLSGGGKTLRRLDLEPQA